MPFDGGSVVTAKQNVSVFTSIFCVAVDSHCVKFIIATFLIRSNDTSGLENFTDRESRAEDKLDARTVMGEGNEFISSNFISGYSLYMADMHGFPFVRSHL